MKNHFLKLTLCLGGFCAAAMTTLAAPLQRADLPSDPVWALHIDCDGLRPTAIGQHILSEMEKPEAQAKLASFQAVFNFDLRKQLHGLSFYGNSTVPEDGILLVYADFDAERLVTLAKGAKEYQSSEHNHHIIHSWIDEKKKARNGTKPRIYAAIQGPRVIFGQREATVAGALDVLDGGANLAASNNFPELGAAGSTAFLQGATRKVDVPDSAPNAAILRLTKLLRVEVGEAQQQVTATITMVGNDEEVAKNITSIAQGLVSLMKMRKDKPEAVKIAEAISVKQDGAVAVSTFAMPTTDVIELLKASAARKAQKAGKD
jgi:uncharacterized protein (UPF0147 family)